MKRCSVSYIEQKIEFDKFNCFFIDFLRYSFGRIKIISTVPERKYTPVITWQISFAYQLTDFYRLIGFTEQCFLTDYSYILENHFYFVNVPAYCFKPSLSRMFCVNNSVKVLSPQYECPSTHIFRKSSFCTFVIYRMKEVGRFRSAKANPKFYVFTSSQIQESSWTRY